MSLPSFTDPPFACPPEPLVLTLPIPPSTNNLFFNSRGGHAGRVRTPEYRAWLTEAGHLLNAQRPTPRPGKVHLLIEVAEPEDRRRQDIANREKAVTDLLVTHGIIEGDDQRFVREITMRWAPIKGVQVTVRACA